MKSCYHGIFQSRAGGCLTDALCADAQADVESALALSTAVRSGINFILHAGGILGSYIAMSFEKFLVDEEICGMVLNMIKPLALTDESIDLDMIKQVGIGGQYLTHPKTFQLCQTEFFMPALMSRKNIDAWTKDGKKRIDQIAEDKVALRLASYEKPDINPKIEQQSMTSGKPGGLIVNRSKRSKNHEPPKGGQNNSN